jgi:hypothetical protein
MGIGGDGFDVAWGGVSRQRRDPYVTSLELVVEGGATLKFT